LFFQTSYFFSLKNVGTSDPPYAGDRYDNIHVHNNKVSLEYNFI
jgi:hypothetical protein